VTSAAGPYTFVLVHGGRHGGWAWRPVAQRLRDGGHEVLTPTLTGLGERAHLLTRDVGLDTHINDLVATFEFEDLEDVVLVAHSYAGMPVAGAMDRIGTRVRRLVFVDARIPYSGESILDLTGSELASTFLEMVNRDGDGWFVPNSDATWWGLTDPDQIAWVNTKTTPQPMKSYTDHVDSADLAWTHPGTFIQCNPSHITDREVERLRARAARDDHFHLRQLNACHDAMLTAPDELTQLLLEAAEI
jgi:pimeloyl-ACP methyl ester carboxylesterase